MSFSAPSPPDTASSSSSQRNSAHTSPQIPSADLGVDPSDPFNLLMHQSRSSDTSMDDSSGESLPDWTQLPSVWPTSTFDSTFGADSDQKAFTHMDFDMGLSSDFDFVSSMGIDPNALQFDNQKMGFSYQDFNPNNLLPTSQSFPFTFQAGSPESITSSDSSQHQRRLSVTSSSSSSGASLSPIVESRSPSLQAQEQSSPSAHSAAEELAQRVRQSAGVMWAVPMNQSNGANTVPPNYIQTTSSSSPIPIPAPSPNNAFLSSGSSISSAASTPPPSTPPPFTSTENLQSIDKPMPDLVSANGANATGASMSVLSRPKTSHTTIERRYRTNLNARIMNLRMAVPALRVLEDRDGTGVGGGGKKAKGKNATLGRNVVFGSTVQVKKEGEEGEDMVDVIDERGFVDGVKVARKCSKANVLGKAVEYIRVLKKRELRLKREQEGLKSLVNGLVGGPALLREWEREWREKFGGEERDEVEGEDIQYDGSDDEGAGSGDDEEEDESTRKRKKPKVASAPVPKVPKEKKQPPPPLQPQIMPDGSIVIPEKRKRGRPRKVQPQAQPPPPVTAAVVVSPIPATQVMQGGDQTMFVQQQQQHHHHHPTQPAQYLLATFALFSFFNNPFSSSSSSHPPPNHTHTGTVVAHEHGQTATSPINFGDVWTGQWRWHDVIQVFHLLVSVLVFMSIVLPWLPIPSKYFSLSYLSSSFKSYRTRSSTSASATSSTSTSATTSAPKKPRSRSASLVAALSLSKRGTADEVAGIRGALGSPGSRSGIFGMLSMMLMMKKSKENVGFEKKGLEQRAWVRVGEICVLGGETSTINRALTWWHMRSHLSWFTASAADLSTLALVAWPLGQFARRHSRAVWDAARARKTLNHNLPSRNSVSGDRDGGVNVQARAHERLALESMNVDEAIEAIEKLKEDHKIRNEELNKYSPIGVLAWMLVRTRVKRHLQVMFVKAVLPRESLVDDEDDTKSSACADEKEDDERRRTIEAARSLGGKMAELGDVLQKVGTMGVWELDDLASFAEDEEQDEEPSLDTEIKLLLNALILYRQIFSSSILESAGYGSGVSILLSPPPSPGSRDMKLHLALRKVLGSSVFDLESGPLGGALEDARDKVVDMLVESERARR
ncbi:hypothetical protein D9758_009218 [Tetrapyrgos nigripes]|uniref:BHLH domain-containing protein n=1 Tax=Tetrapyrgos nigripes TaxID=182062 RepID=A0A8H5FWX9_9AGAR|nr:hypothetical protein D9758_009218 [Tetrapyrgos nigripes]